MLHLTLRNLNITHLNNGSPPVQLGVEETQNGKSFKRTILSNLASYPFNHYITREYRGSNGVTKKATVAAPKC